MRGQCWDVVHNVLELAKSKKRWRAATVYFCVVGLKCYRQCLNAKTYFLYKPYFRFGFLVVLLHKLWAAGKWQNLEVWAIVYWQRGRDEILGCGALSAIISREYRWGFSSYIPRFLEGRWLLSKSLDNDYCWQNCMSMELFQNRGRTRTSYKPGRSHDWVNNLLWFAE